MNRTVRLFLSPTYTYNFLFYSSSFNIFFGMGYCEEKAEISHNIKEILNSGCISRIDKHLFWALGKENIFPCRTWIPLLF